jgi:hypothetical protein
MKQSYIKHINLEKILEFRKTRRGEPGYDMKDIATPIIKEGETFDGYYQLRGFDDSGVDYFDTTSDGRQHSIGSIGRRLSDNAIIASLWGDLYQHPDYECIWLR